MTHQAPRPRLVLLETDEIGGLVVRSLAGDQGAREQLVRRCIPRVQRTVLLSCGATDDLDDLVQTVMIRVLTKLDSFRGEASFLVWVDRITINEIRSHYRKRRLTLQRLLAYRHEPGSGEDRRAPCPEAKLREKLMLERLAHHLAKLKPNQRLPVVLHTLHGYTTPEISAMLEVPVETTKKRLQRGRQGLKRRLQRDPACHAFFEEA